ncbi:MAG: hypothetical protein IJ689_04855 [Alphaproteobacteria bacterium]|nr:hypothetical protein [Alphaproteobacteria bacterium]
MNKYILMLGIAGVAFGSYAAMASNSATMTVTATIAHDVSLSVVDDIDLGTITINPAYEDTDTNWYYSDSGVITLATQGAVVSASNATFGTFTANIPNPSACSNYSYSCGGLSITGNYRNLISNIFGGDDYFDSWCDFLIKYSGSDNSFKVIVGECEIHDVSVVTTGSHSGTLTISYNPE